MNYLRPTIIALLALAVLLFLVSASAAPGVTTRVSVDSAGNEGNGYSVDAAMSSDGRFVAFDSFASNLVPGDTNGTDDIFVHDRQTGATERVSVDSAGGQANDSSGTPATSTDGRFVAFTSSASNLVPGDTNDVSDIFVHDRQTGATERVSVDSAGGQANDRSGASAISGDGRFVAFGSDSSNLVSGDTNGARDVFVHDRQSGATERVSVDSAGIQGKANSRNPAISGDGRYVAFDSDTSTLVAGDTNGARDLFVHDRLGPGGPTPPPPPPPPANDDFDNSTEIPGLPFAHAIDTRGATTAADDPQCFGQGPTVWYSFTPSADTRIDANTFGSNYDTTLSVYTGSRGALTQIECNDDAQGLQSQVLYDAIAGETYFFMVAAWDSGAGGDLTLSVDVSPTVPGVIEFVKIDADPLAPGIQACRSAVPGATFSIDFIVDSIDPADSLDFARIGNVGFNFATGDFTSPSIDLTAGVFDEALSGGFWEAWLGQTTTKPSLPGKTAVARAYTNIPPVMAGPSGEVIAGRATLTAGAGTGLKTIDVTKTVPVDTSWDFFLGDLDMNVQPNSSQPATIAIGEPCDPPEDTSIGTDVSVPLNGGLGMVGGVEVTFADVTVGGTTTLETSTSGPPPPAGLRIVGTAGQPVYYDISTSAGFSGPVSVCMKYDETQVFGPESALRLQHETGGGFQDITDLPVDTVNDVICGTTTSLSIFILTEPPAGVGGFLEVPAVAGASGADPSLDSTGSSRAWGYAALAGILFAGAVALAAGAWYARRRMS
jgi:hypothetical protein